MTLSASLRHLMAPLAILILPALSTRAENRWIGGDEHDFGAFDEDTGVVYCEFCMVNEGSEPMAILGARANCGCTRPEYSREPVAPGDTAVIRVGYDPKGRPGRFAKKVFVDCSAAPTRSVLTITGTVIGSSNTLRSRYPIEIGPVRMRTAVIPYGRVLKGETMGQYIDAYNASTDTLRPRVEHKPRGINVIVQPAVVPPGEQFVLSTILHSNQINSWGTVTDSLTFYPDSDSREGRKIETVVIIEEDFRKLTPDQLAKAPLIDTSTTAIDLRSLSRSAAPVKESFTVSNRGKSPLIIRDITCADSAVSLEMKTRTIRPGKSSRVDLIIDPSKVKSRDLLNARIFIIANDPAHPTTTVRVVAEMH